MLYVRHLGFKGRFAEALADEDPAALELRDPVRRVEDAMLAQPDITANAVFQSSLPGGRAGVADLWAGWPEGA